MTQPQSEMPSLSELAEAAGLRMEEMDGRQRDVGSPDLFGRIAHFQLADQAREMGTVSLLPAD